MTHAMTKTELEHRIDRMAKMIRQYPNHPMREWLIEDLLECQSELANIRNAEEYAKSFHSCRSEPLCGCWMANVSECDSGELKRPLNDADKNKKYFKKVLDCVRSRLRLGFKRFF